MYPPGMQKNDGKGQYPFADDVIAWRTAARRPTRRRRRDAMAAPPRRRARSEDVIQLRLDGSCREQFESGLLHFVYRIRDRRYLVVDQERGS